MLQLKYLNEFLDLAPGQTLEFEKNNPMFVLEDLLSEYSTPIVLKYSEKNVRLMGAFFFDIPIKQKLKIEVELYDGYSYVSLATLVVDHSNPNRKFAAKGSVSGFLLTGLSRFFSKIKNKKANTLKLGGLRQFSFTTATPTDGSNGYIQEFRNTWDGLHDYIVAPVRNETWNGEKGDANTIPWMNPPNLYGITQVSPAVLFPNVKYVLEQLFFEHGFTLDTSDLTGTYWETIFLLSVKPLDYIIPSYAGSVNAGLWTYATTINYKGIITFKLAEWISPEITCSQLLLQLCKRYGWAALPINDTTIKLVTLKNADKAVVKDFTKYASESVIEDFSEDGKVYAFKNSFPSSESFASDHSLTNFVVENQVHKKINLPTPSGNFDNSLIFVYAENKYYKIDLDPTTNERIWVVYTDNIFNYEPLGNNAAIETEVSTLPMYWTNYKTGSYGYFAYCEQNKNENWGLRTLLYTGVVNDCNADGTVQGTDSYPLMSSICTDNLGFDFAVWSNVFTHLKNNIDHGIINYWFKNWLAIIGLEQIDEQRLFLPLHELVNLQWTDIINLFNVPYFIKSYTQPRPYKGYIVAKLKRLLLSPVYATPVVEDNAGLFIKIGWENVVDSPDLEAFGTVVWTNVKKGKLIIRAFADATQFVPKSISNLQVLLSQQFKYDDGGLVPGIAVLNCNVIANGSVFDISVNTIFYQEGTLVSALPDVDGLTAKSYHPVLSEAGVNWNLDISLRNSPNYTIIT